MDSRDIINVGNDIMEAVNDAVNSRDYSGLNEALRNVTGNAAGTAADALYGLKGRLQGEDAASSQSGSAAGPGSVNGQPVGQERTYGHAGRASSNVTQEYMNRAAGARHHTTYSSRISPFLQRQVSRGSGNGKIAGGIVSLAFAGITFLETVASGLLSVFSPFGGELFSAWSLFTLIVAGGLAILGGILIKSGKERKKLVREYYEYGRAAGTSEYIEIGKLAEAVGESRETVLDNLEKMISEEMLPAAWFDRQKTTLMLSERMYNEYLRLERERQEQEAADAAARMESGAAGAGTRDAAAAGQDLPEDLRLRPEDEKLPEDARKIVGEGLLYMGRIRAYNRAIGDEEISAELARLELTMQRIIEQIRKDPSSAPNLRRLMVYYLPTTMKLLQAYGELDGQPVEGENIAGTKREIREALGTINLAFENLLDSLFQDMAWDISSDISVMKTMMEQDGLTGDQMRRAAAQQKEQGASAASQAAAGTAQQKAVTSAAQAAPQQPAFTEGYTEDFAEGLQSGAQQAQAAAPDTQEQGIRLTFGE